MPPEESQLIWRKERAADKEDGLSLLLVLPPDDAGCIIKGGRGRITIQNNIKAFVQWDLKKCIHGIIRLTRIGFIRTSKSLKDNFGHKIIILRGVTTGFSSDEERLSAANRQYSVEFGFFETRPTYSEE